MIFNLKTDVQLIPETSRISNIPQTMVNAQYNTGIKNQPFYSSQPEIWKYS